MKTDTYTDVVETLENGQGSDLLDQALAIQRQINSGLAWRLQGSFGRAAMDMIESGRCMVGLEAHRDYYGNMVPSRDMLQDGTKGTPGFVSENMGKEWLDAILKSEAQQGGNTNNKTTTRKGTRI